MTTGNKKRQDPVVSVSIVSSQARAALDDPRFDEIQDIGDIEKHLKTEIADFFVNYKRLEPKKWVKVKEWKDAEAAEKMIFASFQLYKEEFHTT